MAYWNAPSDVKNHQDKAVCAALQQIQYLDTLNIKLNEDSRFDILTKKIGEDIIDIGIGLNTGLAVVGEMGSETRSDYTVIGDSVNLASRVESLCKMYGVKCMISNHVKDGLEESYILRLLDRVRVKGKTEPVQLFEVINFGAHLTDEIQKELDMYHNALLLYYNEQFEEALEIFEELYEVDSDISKKVYELYIQRCEEYSTNPPEDFDGITTLNSKA
jgi:adenylate cyclase